jgi:hypothetical protein
VGNLLAFIERELPASGEIGAHASKSVDPFALRERLAELFLFAHLLRHLGSGVQPAAAALKSDKRPEIDAAWRGLTVKFEVYSPLDLVGFQLLEEHLPAPFKYLDVDRGFVVEIMVYPVDTSKDSVWYPYALPGQQDVLTWLGDLGRTAQAFLSRPAVSPGEQVWVPGPGGTTTVRLKVREVFDDPAIRRVIVTRAGQSTDARLVFECGTVDDTAQSRWGKKLQDKMRQRQAGVVTPGVLRIFILNFAQADTGWPDYFTWPDIGRGSTRR